MPKQLINLIGILISVAVLALGVFLVAVPLVAQSLAVDSQAQQVTQTNRLYQEQVNALLKAKESKATTDASVAALRTQIPMTPKLDDIFALVADAATSTGVSITAVTAGTPALFSVRTDATSIADQKAAPSTAPTPTPTAGTAAGESQQGVGESGQTGTAGGSGTQTPTSGSTRSQVDFTITVTATDMSRVTAFLDALRAGPRLLSNITSVVAPGTGGIGVQITALTFVDGAPVATGATK